MVLVPNRNCCFFEINPFLWHMLYKHFSSFAIFNKMTGPCKVRNETETKRNETKQIETKRNQSKRNETDRNETKQIETKRNKTKRNKSKRNETNDMARHCGQKIGPFYVTIVLIVYIISYCNNLYYKLK